MSKDIEFRNNYECNFEKESVLCATVVPSLQVCWYSNTLMFLPRLLLISDETPIKRPLGISPRVAA